MKKKLFIIGLLYFVIILVFGIIYYSFWMKNTSYFIYNEKYNEVTLGPVYSYSELPLTFKYISTTLSVKQTNEILLIKYDSIEFCQNSIIKLSSLINNLTKEDSILHSQLFTSSDENLQNRIINKTKVVDYKIDSLSNLYTYSYDSLEFVDNRLHQSNINIRLANFNYEIAQLKYKKALIISALHDDRIENMVKYYDTTVYKRVSEMRGSQESLNEQNVHFNKLIVGYQQDIANTLRIYHAPRFQKITFWDFIYFSATTATSGGYGDFIPNNTIVRLLVTIEIISSIILFSTFFYFLGDKRTIANKK